MYRKSKPRALSTAGIELETSNTFFNNASHIEPVLEAPATNLLENTTEQQLHIPAKAFHHFTSEAIEEGMKYVLQPNKIKHIFDKPMHNLDQLVIKLGNQEAVISEVIKKRIIDGIPKIGTFFIK